MNLQVSDIFEDTISHMKELKSLSLTSCKKFHDHHIRSFKFSRLTDMCFEELKFISTEGFQDFCKQCPFIENLELKNCRCISDEIIEVMTKELKYLKVLDIRGGKLLTEKSIEALVENSKSIKVCCKNNNFLKWCSQQTFFFSVCHD